MLCETLRCQDLQNGGVFYLIAAAILYGINIPFGGTSIVINYYPLLWINIPGALAGTWIIYKLSCLIVKSGCLFYLNKLGEVSLIIFCIHAIDLKTNISHILGFHNVYIIMAIRIFIAYMCLVIANNRLIRKLLYL